MPLVTTLEDLTPEKLEAYAAPPLPVDPFVQPTTDLAVITQTDYLKLSNKFDFQRYGVDVPNTNTFAAFRNEVQNWAGGAIGKSAPLPPMPVYKKLDDAGFETWWATFCANLGKDAPPATFIVDLPPVQPPTIITIAPPVLPQGASPVGKSNGGGNFMSAPGDSYPDGYIYPPSGTGTSADGAIGRFVKHVFQEPMNIVAFWTKIA